MSFRNRLQTALEALTDKRLTRAYFLHPDLNCHCALGAIMAHEKLPLGWASYQKIKGFGPSEATQAMGENDNFEGTEKERHAHMLEWSKQS